MRLTHETARYVEVLEAPRETVLAALIQVYQELEIPVAGTDPATGEIGNPSFEPRRIGGQLLSRFLNCGSSGVTGRPNADSYRVTMYLVSRVESTEDGRTRLSTEVDARAQARGVSGYPVQCQSRGTLETRIAEMVEERIG